jgi:methionyl-tRNA formyltransferase
MFDTIILLASKAEQVAMPPVLRGHNLLLTVISVGTAADLATLNSDLLERARLIAFATPEIVSQNILEKLGYGAFNFHPGPPSYPGWAPAHFALYERATEFGATVHVMVEQVDAGPIIDVELFPIPAEISVLALRCSEATILACARRSIFTASSFAPCCRRVGKQPLSRSDQMGHSSGCFA